VVVRAVIQYPHNAPLSLSGYRHIKFTIYTFFPLIASSRGTVAVS
jgi:hypothetical protein